MTTHDLPTLIPVSRLRLALDNPRHSELPKEADAIDVLLKREKVVDLAKDIAKNGTNPMESVGVVKNPNGNSFTVVEGNRRACALVLLNDPQKAPVSHRHLFADLKARHSIQDTVAAFVFTSRGDADPWLDRMHAGANEGIGRRAWTALQKARHDPSSGNRQALDVMVYADAEGIIDIENDGHSITTVQRFIGNPGFRSRIDIVFDQSDPNGFKTRRTEAEINGLLKRFFEDLLDDSDDTTPKSRWNAEMIEAYAEELLTAEGLSEARTGPDAAESAQEAESSVDTGGPTESEGQGSPASNLGGSTPEQGGSSTTSDPVVRQANRIPLDRRIESGLKALNNYKLLALYKSLHKISAHQNTVLVTVGAWAFLESLTSFAGRADNTSFPAFLNGQWQALGLPTNPRSEKQTITQAIDRLSENGNTTKHHRIAANFNAAQLLHDFELLTDVILACIERAAAQRAAADEGAE